MLLGKRSVLTTRRLYYGVAMVCALILSGCMLFSSPIYSTDEQFGLYATRSAQMRNQLEFTFKFMPDSVPVEHDIFFVATFTNTTDHPIVFRKPEQSGVSAMFGATLLFAVEPISVTIPFEYPREVIWEPLGLLVPIKPDEFVTLPSLGRQDVRLQLPHFVFQNADNTDVIPLPIGQYFVRMTYHNFYIGYDVGQYGERHVDLRAWVGSIESPPASLTITP